MKKLRLSGCKIVLLGALLLSLVTVAAWAPQPASAATPFDVRFDFDTCTPILSEGRGTPFSQTSGAVTATFSSPYDPATFSVQSYGTTFLKLSQFSGKYLYDNNPSKDSLYVQFSAPLTSINLTFATVEYHGGSADLTSGFLLTAYLNSTNSLALVGTTTAHAAFSSDSFPQGSVFFSGNGEPFDLVRLEVSYQQGGATDFFVDNIRVTGTIATTPTPTPSPSPSPTPTAAGSASPPPSSTPTGSTSPPTSPSPAASSSPSLPPGASQSPTPSDAVPTASPAVPEFSPAIILPLFIAATAFAILIARKKGLATPR